MFPEHFQVYVHFLIFTVIYSSKFIQNCQNLGAIKVSFSRYNDKQTTVRSDDRILFQTKEKQAFKS